MDFISTDSRYSYTKYAQEIQAGADRGERKRKRAWEANIIESFIVLCYSIMFLFTQIIFHQKCSFSHHRPRKLPDTLHTKRAMAIRFMIYDREHWRKRATSTDFWALIVCAFFYTDTIKYYLILHGKLLYRFELQVIRTTTINFTLDLTIQWQCVCVCLRCHYLINSVWNCY